MRVELGTGVTYMRLMRTILRALVLMLVVGLMVLVVTGCEDLGGGGGTDTSLTDVSVTDEVSTTEAGGTSTSEATETTAAPSTPTTLASTERQLPSGNITSMGYIDDVWIDGGVRYLSIDYCEFVYGDEATEAAREDGEIGPTEEWDLDFYIRNQSTKLRTWRISNSVDITTSTRWPPNDGMEAPCSWADFLSFWGPGPLPDGDSWLYSVPWWIERDGDTVVKIAEQYLP
jgi:hypothetical protein